jgi:hypothetical protein
MKKTFYKYFVPHEENEYKPHFLGEKSVVALSLIILFLFVLSIFQFALISYTDFAAVISSVLVDLTNHDRDLNNVSPLVVSDVLKEAAQMKANDMALKGYFSHKSPDGETPWHWFKKAGYEFDYAGENLAVNFFDSNFTHDAWMGSEGHRLNILNSNFTEIGVATAKGVYNGKETIFVVQMFGKPTLKPVVSTVEEPLDEISESVVLEEDLEVVVEKETFIAVKNTESSPSVGLVASDTSVGYQASVIDRTLASPQRTLFYSYLIIGSLVMLALIFLVFVEIRKQDFTYVFYAFFLVMFMLALEYINRAVILPDLMIR